MIVYFPVWVDIFGDDEKTLWLSYLQIGVPIGVFLGYAITAVFNSLHEHIPIIDVIFLEYKKIVEMVILFTNNILVPNFLDLLKLIRNSIVNKQYIFQKKRGGS